MRRRILSTGALQIVFVQPDDAGRYTCIAANLAGSSTSSMELAVHSKWDCTETIIALLQHDPLEGKALGCGGEIQENCYLIG